MKKLITDMGAFGPFQSIDVLADRYRCDGIDYPFAVVGQGELAEWTAADAPAPVIDIDALQAGIVEKVQQRLDNFAQSRGYDGILSAATYAASSVPKFKAEGQYAVDVRDATWAKLYAILEEVQAGERTMPSGYGDIEAELPELEWPQ